jgi:hypothetical protein
MLPSEATPSPRPSPKRFRTPIASGPDRSIADYDDRCSPCLIRPSPSSCLTSTADGSRGGGNQAICSGSRVAYQAWAREIHAAHNVLRDGASADDQHVSGNSVSGTSPTKLDEQFLNSYPVEERPVCFVGHTDSKASGSTITPRLLNASGEWRARYSWKAGLSPMNQSLFSRVSFVHSGAASPARINRSSLDPARSASQRRSPVVEGLPKKTFLSAGRDTHLKLARCSRTIRKSSLWDHPLSRPCRMEAAASGTATNRFTKIGLSEPAAIASVRRSRVTGPGTLSPLT